MSLNQQFTKISRFHNYVFSFTRFCMIKISWLKTRLTNRTRILFDRFFRRTKESCFSFCENFQSSNDKRAELESFPSATVHAKVADCESYIWELRAPLPPESFATTTFFSHTHYPSVSKRRFATLTRQCKEIKNIRTKSIFTTFDTSQRYNLQLFLNSIKTNNYIPGGN